MTEGQKKGGQRVKRNVNGHVSMSVDILRQKSELMSSFPTSLFVYFSSICSFEGAIFEKELHRVCISFPRVFSTDA